MRAAPPYIKGMSIRMKPLLLAILAVLSFGAQAQDAPFAPVPADQVVMADLLFLKRAVVVFADSANDPNFVRQMELLTRDTVELTERDVIVITDTTPQPKSDIRAKLRPSGFSLVILDKDGSVALRKPLPWDTREITHAIDKFPSRRIEVLERMPAGR